MSNIKTLKQQGEYRLVEREEDGDRAILKHNTEIIPFGSLYFPDEVEEEFKMVTGEGGSAVC